MHAVKVSTSAVILAVVFCVLGVGILVLGIVLAVHAVPVAPAILIAVGVLFVIAGVIPIPFVARIRAEERSVDGTGSTQAGATQGWDRLHAEIVRAFEGSPYTVAAQGASIVVVADLADARFLTLGSARRVRVAYATHVLPVSAGVVARVDSMREIEWTAGVGGTLAPRFTGRARAVQGRVVTMQTRKEVGVDANGVGLTVDYAFSSGEIARPLKRAIAEAGFRDTLPASARLPLVMAIVAGGGGVLVGLGFALAAALGLYG